MDLFLTALYFIADFPIIVSVSEKIQSYFFPFRQSYVCGKKNAFFGKCLTFQESERREFIMKNNQINVPQAKQAMEQFKMQAASEVGVNLTNGYNGHLTSREAGSVGGQMVKNNCPIRTLKFQRHNRIAMGHIQTVQYIAAITI